jgi:hypothetical protein
MSLELAKLPITGVTKQAIYNNLSISQDREGNMSMSICYDIVTSDENGRELRSDRENIYLDQSEMMAQENFGAVYVALKNVARKSLQNKYPELIK